MISPESSVIFNVGGLNIHYYGVIMFFAIFTAIVVMYFAAKKHYKDVDTDVLIDILPIVILCSIVSARLYYVALDWKFYSQHLGEIFAVWHGGLSIHGGIIGGVISGVIISKIKKINFLKYADVFSLGLILGQAVGRFGNFFNSEAFGKPCSIPYLKLYVSPAHRPFGFEDVSYFHPTFLYESLWDVIVFLILFFIVRKITGIKDGTIFLSYILLYSIGRLFIEACRLDSVLNIWGVPVAQIVSGFLILFAAAALYFLYHRRIGRDV